MLFVRRHINAIIYLFIYFFGNCWVLTLTALLWKCFIPVLWSLFLLARTPYFPLENKNRLQARVGVCSKIAGINLNDLSDVYKLRTLNEACSLLTDQSHPLVGEFVQDKQTKTFFCLSQQRLGSIFFALFCVICCFYLVGVDCFLLLLAVERFAPLGTINIPRTLNLNLITATGYLLANI